MAPPPRRSRRLALKHVSINDLPEPALRAILLTAVKTDNLLRYVAACARVCADWRRLVRGSAAYGHGLPLGRLEDRAYDGESMAGAEWVASRRRYRGDEGERARVLREVAEALDHEGDMLDLGNKHIGDGGAAALAAALLVIDEVPWSELHLHRSELTAVGARALAPALKRRWWTGCGLRVINLNMNPLDSSAVRVLAAALPPTLDWLRLGNTRCDDDGLIALAEAFPRLPKLERIMLIHPQASARGWAALAGALPSLPALERLDLPRNPGLAGYEAGLGVRALAAAIPRCPRLMWLDVSDCGLGQEARNALFALERGASGEDQGLRVFAESRFG